MNASIYRLFKTTYISISVCLIIQIPSYSQDFFDNNPVWRINSQCAENTPSCISHNDYNYFINGDTVLDGHYYRKLFRYGNGYFTWLNSPPTPPDCIGSFTIGSMNVPYNLIRDTLEKIYLYGNPELCIYDFNLNVGDTLPACYGLSNQTVLFIDSILINNIYRKKFYLSHTGGQATLIIEGMGHTNGFIEGLPPVLDCAASLDCFSVNDTSYYPTIGLMCLTPNSINDISERDFSFFPLPVNDFLHIRSDNRQIASIGIIDLFGKLGGTFTNFKNNEDVLLDLSDKPNGIYFLDISILNHHLFYKLIVFHQ